VVCLAASLACGGAPTPAPAPQTEAATEARLGAPQGGPAAPRSARAWTDHDEFTGRTAHRAEIPLGPDTTFTLINPAGSQTVLGAIHTFSRSWAFLRCHSTHGLADDVPLPLTNIDHNGSVIQGGVVE